MFRAAGAPATGVGSSLPLRTMRRRPGRSVTSIAPSGSHATVHGFSSPVTTAVTRIRCPSPVSNSIGSFGSGRLASPVGATGCRRAPSAPSAAPKPTDNPAVAASSTASAPATQVG